MKNKGLLKTYFDLFKEAFLFYHYLFKTDLIKKVEKKHFEIFFRIHCQFFSQEIRNLFFVILYYLIASFMLAAFIARFPDSMIFVQIFVLIVISTFLFFLYFQYLTFPFLRFHNHQLWVEMFNNIDIFNEDFEQAFYKYFDKFSGDGNGKD